MKSFFWYVKVGFLCAALLVLFGTSGVTAQDEGIGIEGGSGCNWQQACERSSTNQCFCTGAMSCTGCFIPNGGTGCGTCH
jgi:hypothetical protein